MYSGSFHNGTAQSSKGDRNGDLTTEHKKAKANRLALLKKKTWCHKCGRIGHWGDDCTYSASESSSADDLKISQSRKPDKKPHHKTSSHHKSSRRQRSQAHLSKSSHASFDSNSESSEVSSEAYVTSSNSIDSDSDSWYADSGATESMTDKRHWFTTFEPIAEHCWSVTIADGHQLSVQGIGSIRVQSLINGRITQEILENVLYVPLLSKNLVSISQLMDLNIAVVFLNNTCKMISQAGQGRLIFTGQREKLLWRLNIMITPPSSSLNVAITVDSGSVTSKADHILQRWHMRLGHANSATIKQMAQNQAARGLSIPSSAKLPFCIVCVKGKQHRASFPVNAKRHRAKLPGEFFHLDISGPLPVPSLGGHIYFVTFKDDHSGYRFLYLMKRKNEVYDNIQRLYQTMKYETGHRICKFRSDNGKEYKNGRVALFFDRKGVRQEFTTSYTPEQNSVAERDNRTLMEMVRCMLFNSNLDSRFWGEALNNAVYTLKRVASQTIHGCTPFEKWYFKQPDISHLRVFGSPAYAHIPKELRKKLDNKTKECFFLGYSNTSKAYRLWDSQRCSVILSRDVVFDEDSALHVTMKSPVHRSSPYDLFPALTSTFPLIDEAEASVPVVQAIPSSILSSQSGDLNFTLPDLLSLPSLTSHSNDHNLSSSSVPSHDSFCSTSSGSLTLSPTFPNSFSDDTGNFTSGSTCSSGSHHTQSNEDSLNPILLERSLSDIYSQLDKEQLVELQSTAVFVNTAFMINEPSTYNAAMRISHKTDWQRAMNDELNSLLKNHTWDLVPLPLGRHSIKNKWVYKVKAKPDGSIERFKARLVAKGFSQSYGIDYDETYSPVAKMDSIRTLLSIAAVDDIEIVQFDVKTAFLYGTLDEDIYMDPPQGLEVPSGFVCHLQKSLYGLKQASRC